MKEFSDERCEVYDFTELKHVKFRGEEINTRFTSVLDRWGRSFSFNSNALAIKEADNMFRNDLSGYIGVAPYATLTLPDRERNFMYQLKKNGYIDHLVVAFYTTGERQTSLVKFGNYDEVGFADKNDFVTLITRNKGTWDLNSN